MNAIKISVVVPCYNVEQYIRRGLDSILAQTMQDWEAILVDDGATDNTGRICEEYAAMDCRFHVIHQENQGLSCARNSGMKEVTGELLYFLDPDDRIESNCFERCYETYKQYDCDMINFGFWWVYGEQRFTDSNNEFKIFKGNDIHTYYTKQHAGFSQEALNRYFKHEFIWNNKKYGQVWSYMFRKSFIQKNGLTFSPGLKMAEDAIFMVEASYRAKEIVRIPDIMYHYIQRDSGLVNMKKDASYLYEYKLRQNTERRRLRELIKEFDLLDSYIGTNILSCLQLALKTSNEWQNYKLFRKYVTQPEVQESIQKVSLEGAPFKFTAPVRLLKARCHKLLFIGCWLLHKTALANKITM